MFLFAWSHVSLFGDFLRIGFYSILAGSEHNRSTGFVRGSEFYGLRCANVACSMASNSVVDQLECAYRTCISSLGSIWDAGNVWSLWCMWFMARFF